MSGYSPIATSSGSHMTYYSGHGMGLSAGPGETNADNVGSPRHLPFMPVLPENRPGYLGSVATPPNIGEHRGPAHQAFSPGAALFPPRGGRRGPHGTGNVGPRAISGPYGAPSGK
jgi:hypothetical protein